MIYLVTLPPSTFCLCYLFMEMRQLLHIYLDLCFLFPPLCLSLSSPFLRPLPSTPSLQTQRTRATQGPQHSAQEAASGLHRPAAPHTHCHLQGEQAPIQGNADHHLPAAGTGAQHRQQLLHECTPPLRGPLARRPQRQPRAAGHIRHHLLQGLKRGEDLQRAREPGWITGQCGKLVVKPGFTEATWPGPSECVLCLPKEKKSFVPCNHLFCQSELQALT